jgi:DNA-binding LacI/PurR family transcriptional regulator
MPVSLREVAARAGVARGTVSSVLNNRSAEARISAQTQARVRHIAAEMGYRPNRLAQGLGRGSTNIIGLMIPGLRNPFFLSLLEIAEDRALRAGYDVLADTAFQMRGSYDIHAKLSGWPIDGVLIWVTPDMTLADYLGAWTEGIPAVYLGYPRDDGADYVAIDRDSGVRQVMEHLRERGYRRIAYLYPWTGLQPVDARYAFYAALCAEAGQEPEQILLEPLEQEAQMSPITQAGLREAALKTGLSLAARPPSDRPDALICHNDLVAIGLFNGLRRAGLRVPEDIAVVGFDGIDEGLYLEKPLTTVVSPGAQLVETALGILTRRLKGERDADRHPQQVILSSELRFGGTT